MGDTPTYTAEMPEPVLTDGPSMHDLVRADLVERKAHGLRKYTRPLQAFNGRPALKDAYEEVLDLAVYLRQAIEEQAGAHTTEQWAVVRDVADANSVTAPLHVFERDSEEECREMIADWFKDGIVVRRTVTYTATPWTEVTQ